jgi:MFS transporter, AAHS family, 4-hydroxybenzoate transporter
MKYKQLALIFICNLVPLFIGMGLFPLLPLYAARFGATQTVVGLYYAIVYVASAVSVFMTGWLATRLRPRGLFMAGATLGIPALALLGLATTLWQVVLLTAIVWFCGGITLTLLNVFIGLSMDAGKRGRVFSLMFLAYPLGAVLGGTAIGQLVMWQGYSTMFMALAAVWTLQPLAGTLLLRRQAFAMSAANQGDSRGAASAGRPFAFLLLSSLLILLAIGVGRLGTSLSMQSLGFAPGALASTATVSGLATIPVTLLLGVLSDRLGRARTLLLSYLLAASGAATLVMASQLWHFWLATTLLFAAWCASRSLASAMASDMLPAAALSSALPRLSAMDSLASIVGFAGAGYALETLGGLVLYSAAVGCVLIAALLLVLALRRQPQPSASLVIPAGSPARAASAGD